MNKDSSIFLAGHKGLVGSSVLNDLKSQGFKKIITIDKKKVEEIVVNEAEEISAESNIIKDINYKKYKF